MAKFKVGDKVKWVKAVGPNRDRVRIVTSVYSGADDGKYLLDDDIVVHESEMVAANAARSRNAVVAKAMNAVARNGYVKLYAKAGGTATVYEGDKVEYDGKVYTAKALGSPSMDSAILVDDAGNKLVVKMKDYKLKAVNAKFKKGDRVKYVGSKHGAPYGKVLTIVKEPDNLGRYIVHWDSDHSGFMAVGSDGFAYEDELALANAARNSKFKVGDKVVVKGIPGSVWTIVRAYDIRPGAWWITDGIIDQTMDEKFLTLANSRSRNSVVAKALNARARNDEQFHTYLVPVLRKGVKDYVTIERVADEETAKKLVDVPSFRIIGVTVDKTRPVKKARNAEDDFLQYYADSYSYIPKVGEIYKYDGKRVKCTSVQKLQRGNDDRDRFLVEGRVVG